MTFERSFMNWDEEFCVFCWTTPSKEGLVALFKKAGTPFDQMITVEEHQGDQVLKF